MGYQEVLEIAGYRIISFKEFGEYQGVWAAFLYDGSIITDDFGSCSGCDALEAFIDHLNGDWDYEPTAEECLKFVTGQDYNITKDYEQFYIEEKWNSEYAERANWIRERVKIFEEAKALPLAVRLVDPREWVRELINE